MFGLLVGVVFCVALGCGGAPSPVPPPAPGLRQLRPPPPPGTGDITRKEHPWPLPLDTAEEILLRTTLFEIGGMPEKRQVQAFNVVFEQRDALERFRRVARQAGPAGRLYALCALLELSPVDGEALRADLAGVTDRVTFIDSDVVHERRLCDLVDLVLARKLGAEFQRSRREIEKYFRRTG